MARSASLLLLAGCTMPDYSFATPSDASVDASTADASIDRDAATTADAADAARDADAGLLPPDCVGGKLVEVAGAGPHCYFVLGDVGGGTSCSKGQDKCAVANAHLATIPTAEERDAIVAALTDAGITSPPDVGFWIGLRGPDAGSSDRATFQWITKEPRGPLELFPSDKPNGTGPCVVYKPYEGSGGTWDDKVDDDTNVKPALCERDPR